MKRARLARALPAFFVLVSRLVCLVCLVCVVLREHPAAAQPTPEPAPAQPSDEARKTDAKAHFDLGLSHFDREEWQAALVEFLKSHELFPSKGNTKNAAICLRKVGRYDESLEMFEKLVTDFPELAPADRTLAEHEIAELKASVGTIDLANVPPDATVVVDGVDRGKTPLRAPIRLSAGGHVVRVLSEGSLPFEQRVDVAGKQAVVVKVTLTPLTQAGRLHVTERTGKTLEVFLDGASVGKTPFDGAVAPGPHTVVLKGEGALGTQPMRVNVTLDKVLSLDPAAEELRGELRIEASPAAATISIDGVGLGLGLFEGRLRTGNHKVVVSADGYVKLEKDIVLEPDQPQTIQAKLVPIARPVAASHVLVELDAGLALGAIMGGDIANGCNGSCSASLPVGFQGLLHGAYQLGSGLGLGVHAGYLVAFFSQTGRADTIAPVGKPTNQGSVNDSLRLGGLTAGLEAQYKIGTAWPATIRLGAGVLLGSLQDTRNGNFTDSTGAAYTMPDNAQSFGATFLYLSPEGRIGKKLGDSIEVSVGARLLVMAALSTPRWDNSKLINAGKDGAGPMPAESLLGGVVLMAVPSAALTYVF